jgi:hypothetical protein
MVSQGHRFSGENAVASITADHAFLGKHRDKILGVLSCFDRLIFRGHLSLSYPRGLEGFLHKQDVLFKDFKHYAPQIAERLKEHVKSHKKKRGRIEQWPGCRFFRRTGILRLSSVCYSKPRRSTQPGC